MTADSEPLYVSKRSWRSLWQEYRVYPDRIELSSWIGKKVISADEILDIEVRPPSVIGDLFRGKGFAYSLPLKLDMADSCRHVAVHRTSGIMKYLRFTPDDPEEFVEVCKSIMKEDRSMNQQAAKTSWWNRNWKWVIPVGCVAFLLICVGGIGIFVLSIIGATKSSDVYKEALERATSHAAVQTALGTPIQDGGLVSGSIHVSGPSGMANLAIPISGPKGSAAIYAVAFKSAGRWTFSTLEVAVEGSDSRIDLLSITEFPLPSLVTNFTALGDGEINFLAVLSLKDTLAFYRAAFTKQGYTERKALTVTSDTSFSMVFDGHPSGKAIVIQGVAQGGNTNVNIRLEAVP